MERHAPREKEHTDRLKIMFASQAGRKKQLDPPTHGLALPSPLASSASRTRSARMLVTMNRFQPPAILLQSQGQPSHHPADPSDIPTTGGSIAQMPIPPPPLRRRPRARVKTYRQWQATRWPVKSWSILMCCVRWTAPLTACSRVARQFPPSTAPPMLLASLSPHATPPPPSLRPCTAHSASNPKSSPYQTLRSALPPYFILFIFNLSGCICDCWCMRLCVLNI